MIVAARETSVLDDVVVERLADRALQASDERSQRKIEGGLGDRPGSEDRGVRDVAQAQAVAGALGARSIEREGIVARSQVEECGGSGTLDGSDEAVEELAAGTVEPGVDVAIGERVDEQHPGLEEPEREGVELQRLLEFAGNNVVERQRLRGVRHPPEGEAMDAVRARVGVGTADEQGGPAGPGSGEAGAV